jgi:hypothetical protein
MKRKKNTHRRQAAGSAALQIKTTIDFGEDGIPLDRLGEITKLLKERHVGSVSKVTRGFVPIPFDRYVDLHMQSNPSVDRAEFAHRLRQAVDARKAGARCACGAFIWAVGSAEAGAACFTCITGEAWPESDYEIDEALRLPPGRFSRSGGCGS